MRLRIIYEELGGHTHMAIFSGRIEGQLGKSGDLCMTNEEFKAWKDGTVRLEFVERVKEES